MSPQSKTLAGLAALLVVAFALGGYAWFGVQKPDEAEARRKEADARLFVAREAGEKPLDGGALPAAEFRALELSAKGDTTTLEKRDGAWWITSPVKALASGPTVEAIVAQLQNARVKATVEEKPAAAELARYGLDTPRFTVKGTARVPDGKGGGVDREVSLQGGIENTFDGSSYLRKGGDERVYSVNGAVRGALEKSTYELREKSVAGLDLGTLSRIEVKAKANAYTLERDEKKAWRVTKPVALPAEAATLNTLLTALNEEAALAFPKDSPEERKRDGLDAPAVDATFTRSDGGAIRIRLGRALVDAMEKAYALREDKDGALLAEVPLKALGDLDKPAQDFRDRTVLTFPKEQVHRLAFTPAGGGPEVVVERAPAGDAGGEEWAVTAPAKGPAKKWKLSSVIWTLGALKATGFGETPKDWSRYGITDKSRAATLYDAKGAVLARLQLGNAVPKKPDTVYARGTQEQVLEVDTSRLAEVPSTVDDVLNKPAPAAGAGAAQQLLGGPK